MKSGSKCQGLSAGAMIFFLTIAIILQMPAASSAEIVEDIGAEDQESSCIRSQMEDSGIEFGLSLTSVYQHLTRGGLRTGGARRITGLYELELLLDFETLLGVRGGMLYALAEGGFGDGLDGADKVASLFDVNHTVVGYRSIDLVELWYQQAFLDNRLTIRFGKIDLTSEGEAIRCPMCFDNNRFAGDETTQFLNTALNVNPTIPFPDNGLGVIVSVRPIDQLYFLFGAADAHGDARTTGFGTTFHGSPDYFYIGEMGLISEIPSRNGPLDGTYRFGLWYDPQPKGRFDRRQPIRQSLATGRDDVGFYTSMDQMVYRESPDSDKGLGMFFRYGYAPADKNIVNHFWSIGGQYQGLVPGRDEDVLGMGVGQGVLSRHWRRHHDVPSRRETVLEVYYNIKLTDWLEVTPDVQYIFNPGGGIDGARNATVLGLRVKMEI